MQDDGSEVRMLDKVNTPDMQHTNELIRVPYAPLLIVLSGPSGAGKTTLTRALIEQGWSGHVLITTTTRRPRPGETEGIHYHFCTPQRFQQMMRAGEFLEYAEVHGNWYGVPAAPVREDLAAGKDVILTLDPQGAQTIQARMNGAILIFVAPESLRQLTERVHTRGVDSAEQRTLRLLNAEREMAELPHYDYLIVNPAGNHQEAVDRLKAILLAEHSRVHPRQLIL